MCDKRAREAVKERLYGEFSTDEELAHQCVEAIRNLDPDMNLFDAECAAYKYITSKIDGLVKFPVFLPWYIKVEIEFMTKTFECVIRQETVWG